MTKTLLAMAAAAVAVLSPLPAAAALLLAIDVGGVQACASDQNAGCGFGVPLTDIDPTLGVMSFGNSPITIGGLEITGSVQQAIVGGDLNILNTSSTQITNTTGAFITGTLAVSATGFTPPVSTAFVSGSATWQDALGSSVTMRWYNDPANAQGAEFPTDTPGLLLYACSDTVTLPADATACAAGPIPVSDLAPFSMTLYTEFSLAPGATLVNRGMTELKPVDLAVPEPASLLLLGLGVLAVGRKAVRRG